MKKMTLKMRLFGGIVAVSMAFFAVSCADGAPDDERVEIGVYDTQLETPALDASNFAKVTNPDGSESIMVTWPVVLGAKGYLCNVNIVDDPTNPEVIVADSLVDDSSISFPAREETKYEFSLRTIGDPERGNLDAVEAVTAAYSTMVPAIVVPAGEISEFIMANLVDSEDEQAFELAPDTEYTLEGPIDFGLNQFTLRGDKVRHSLITVKDDGCIMTQAGLKVKWINFDCTDMTSNGLITMSPTPDPSIENTVLGYTGGNTGNFLVLDPIIIEDCWIKNLPMALLYDNKQKYALKDFRLRNCLIQCDNATGTSFIEFDNGGVIIRDMTIENNTIWNVQTNNSAYFLRFSNSSNTLKAFGSNSSTNSYITHIWKNNTIAKMFTGKDFGNNVPQNKIATYTVSNNNFYDVYRLYQYLHNNCTRYCSNNAIWYNEASPQSNDYGGRTDTNGNPFCILEEGTTPNAAAADMPLLDLTQPNGGVNFKASGALSSTIGDPRWLE